MHTIVTHIVTVCMYVCSYVRMYVLITCVQNGNVHFYIHLYLLDPLCFALRNHSGHHFPYMVGQPLVFHYHWNPHTLPITSTHWDG